MSIGKKYFNLTILSSPVRSRKGKHTCKCRCDCGHTINGILEDIIIGRQISCGCHERELINGEGKYRLEDIWKSMRDRCSIATLYDIVTKPVQVTYSLKWLSFPVFKEWSMENGYTKFTCLDRIDRNKGYHPNNCKWVTHPSMVSPASNGSDIRHSQYIGVSYIHARRPKCWRATVRTKGKVLTRAFTDEIEAAIWRDNICRQYDLSTLRLNFPNKGEKG